MESKEIKWASTLLQEKSIEVNSIDDFKDGVLLIELLQIITDKKISKYFKSPTGRIQSIENANIALSFMKQNGFLSSQISPQDLVDGSEKSIISILYRLFLLVTSKTKPNGNGTIRKKKYRLSLDDKIKSGIVHSPSTGRISEEDEASNSENDSVNNNNNNNKIDATHSNEPTPDTLEEDKSAWKKTMSPTFDKLKDFVFLGNNRRMTFANTPSIISDSTRDLLSAFKLQQEQAQQQQHPQPLKEEVEKENLYQINQNNIMNYELNNLIDSSNSTPNMLSLTSTPPLQAANSSASQQQQQLNQISADQQSTVELTSSLSTSSINPWFSVKIDANKKEKLKSKVPLLVKISPVDLSRYENPELQSQLLKCKQIVMSYIARKTLKTMSKNNTHRNRCFKEMIATEETYIAQVEKIVKVFYEQLNWNSKYSPQPYLTQNDIQTIFSTIGEIYRFNQELLKRLKEREKTWDCRQKIGDIFTSLGHYLKLYKTYCLNYDSAIECLNSAKKNNEKFQMFIKSILDHPDNVGNQSLESLLITVVQRIPRYILLLQDLYKHTWKDHQDYENLSKAIQMVTEIASQVNKSIAMAESQSKVLEIQKNLVGFEGELVCASRHFVKKGTILNCNLDTSIFSKDLNQMVYILFNDSILFTSERDQKLYFKYFIDLSDSMTRVKDVEDSQVIKNSFQMISGAMTLIFSCPSAKEKKELIDHIQSFQQNKSKRTQSMSFNSSNLSAASLGAALDMMGGDDVNTFFLTGPHTVKIFKSESKKDQGKKEYTLYHISITQESTGESLFVTKRYSDFDHLSKKLKKKFPDQVLKDLPKKHLINSLGNTTVESRRIMLEVYLQHCFQLETIRTSVYLINFIQSLKPLFTSEATSEDLTLGYSRSDQTIKE